MGFLAANQMKISETIPTLKAESVLLRTPSGRPIVEYAQECIRAALEDEKNYNSEAVKCLACCIIMSSLLVSSGCPNCGGHDLDYNINKNDIL